MIEYEVTIPQRPLGVRFAHADHGRTVVVHKVLPDKLGASLGLEPGDILLAVNGTTVLNLTSAEALELFRKAPTPYSAQFRRIEDDDTYLSDEDDEQSEFVRDDAEYLMHKLSLEQYHRSMANIDLEEWSVEDVIAWIQWWSRNLGEPDRFREYLEDFRNADVDGRQLKNVNEDRLREIGVIDDMDIRDLLMGIQDLGGVSAIKPQTRQPRSDTMNSMSENKRGDDDEPDWEAPFLPYLYDAPSVRLSANTVVSVSSARVVAPYKKRPFALYEIDCTDGDNEWLLSKRYSEFWRLFQAMKALGVKTTAVFPARRLFKSTDPAVIEQRKQALTAWLQELLTTHTAARDSKELNEFLSPSRTFVVDA